MGNGDILKAAGAAYKNRGRIISTWQSINNKLLGEKKTIAFTGVSGAGKTVLFDYLSGIAYKQGYLPPAGTSQQVERSKETIQKDKLHSIPKRRLVLTVIPGAASQPRFDAMEDLLKKQHSVCGIVHVVCNGFVSIRQNDARQALIHQFGMETVEAFREHQRKEELRDLEATCNFVTQSIRIHRQPSWMIVALTKVDLYHDSLGDDLQAYSPHHSSEFSDKLNELQHLVGAANFRWEVVPVCCWLEDFEWNGQTVASQMDQTRRDDLVMKLSERIKDYC